MSVIEVSGSTLDVDELLSKVSLSTRVDSVGTFRKGDYGSVNKKFVHESSGFKVCFAEVFDPFEQQMVKIEEILSTHEDDFKLIANHPDIEEIFVDFSTAFDESREALGKTLLIPPRLLASLAAFNIELRISIYPYVNEG